jgi:hypothetical protein
MSIEQKIAQMLAESRANENAEEIVEETIEEDAGDQTPIRTAKEVIPATAVVANPDNAKNAVDDEDEAINGAPAKAKNKVTEKQTDGDQTPIRTATSVKEDVDALINGEDLSEEFKVKAATIFEAAIISRVKDEVSRLEEEFEARLEEEAAKNQEGLVEKVDGYLSYVAEQWIANNEIALESGMKSDILEGFVSGLKGLFEEHYIDVPEEKFDVLASMEETVLDLQAKLDEQVQANVEMAKALNENARAEIIYTASEGLTDTDKEKFFDLAEELSFDNAETFEKKVQTIRENYFTNKASTIVESVVSDTPIEALTEQKYVDPKMKNYMASLNNLK